MPKRPALPHDTVVGALLKIVGVVDNKGQVAGPRHEVWELASRHENIKNKLTANHLYAIVKQNRYGAYSKICEQQNVQFEQETLRDGEDSDEDGEKGQSQMKEDVDFHVIIPPEVWSIIKPRDAIYKRGDNFRTKKIMPPLDWENEIVELLWEQHKLPCPVSFKRATVRSPNSENFVTFDAYCSECGALAHGVIKKQPADGKSAKLQWSTPDTRGIHHEKKRPLQGKQRTTIGRSVLSASTWRKRKAAASMDQGDQEPPTMFGAAVVRRAKNDVQNKDLKLPQKCPVIESLRRMKHSTPWAGTIGDIAYDRFYIHYVSPAQLLVYNDACSSAYVVLSIDATGSLVHGLPTPHDRGGHIFLYEGVIKANSIQLPVVQMLSEKQDANSILYWLNEWQRKGAKRPKEIVVDNSPALKSAIVRAFCGCADVSDYKRRCEEVLEGTDERLPLAFLRLDVVHLLSGAAKWPCWAEISKKRLKSFYLKTLGCLVLMKDKESLLLLMRHVFVVAYSPTSRAATDSIEFISDHIRGSADSEIPTENEEDSTIEENDGITMLDIDCSTIGKMSKEVENAVKDGDDGDMPNPYFLPEVGKAFAALGNDYLLWSGLMVDKFRSPNLKASSASSEGDFGDLKKNILRGEQVRLRVDKFLAIHCQAIEGACRIAGAAQNRPEESTSQVTNISDTSDMEETSNHDSGIENETGPADLSNTENWRGLGSITRNRSKQSAYLTPSPEFSVAVSACELSLPKKLLVKNGNLTGFVSVNGMNVEVSNTCCHDTLLQILAQGYIQFQIFRDSLNLLDSKFVKSIKTLAVKGAVKELYKQRTETLVDILEPVGQLKSAKTRSKRQTMLNLQYDCFTDFIDLAEKLLQQIASVHFTCMEHEHVTTNSVLRPNLEILVQGGITELQEAVNTAVQSQKCDTCGIDTFYEVGNHLLFDTDIFSSVEASSTKENVVTTALVCKLEELPLRLEVGTKKFLLNGVVCRVDDSHVVGVTRRVLTSRWKMFDNLAKTTKSANDSSEVTPIDLHYIETNHQKDKN